MRAWLCWLGLAAALPLWADDPAAAAAIHWPDSSPPALAVGTRDELFDEVPITIVEFKGAGLRIRTASSGDWIRQDASHPRFSLVLQNFDNPGVKLGLAVYAKTLFLPDLEPATWQRYLAALRIRHGTALQIIEDTADRTYFLGRKNREVTYTIPSGSDQPARAHREIFTIVDDKLVIASIEGDIDALPLFHRTANRFLSRLNLED